MQPPWPRCRIVTAYVRLLQVQDDRGMGVPVGFMVCSSDTVEVVGAFLRALQQGVSNAQCMG